MAGAFSFPNAKIGTGLFVHYSDGSSLAKDVTKWLEKNGVKQNNKDEVSMNKNKPRMPLGLQQFFFLDFERGYVLFALDYVSIIILFGTLAYYLSRLIGGKK